ncbi:unnamed protein product, partial [Pylaiella littoralis]
MHHKTTCRAQKCRGDSEGHYNINSRKEDLLDYLDEYVGGFRCDSGEGAGPNVTDIGLGGGRGGGRGGENLGESNTSTGGGEMASA